MTNLKKTFWEVISAYSIEIPTIQRDYTYGRESTKNIRVKFISDIYNTLCLANYNKLHLDFVYGRLEGVENYEMLYRNKQSINTLLESLKGYANNIHIDVNYTTKEKHSESSDMVTFIPLDGQQRLTTLFLLHWYIAKKINNETAIKTLGKFTYSTRNSSKEFIKMLMDHSVDSLNSFSITNSELFFSFWKNDPTVKSMLAVIDEIDNTFVDIDYNQVWHLLTEEKQITFDFFDLDAFDQTDELYVKMNARGKKLSNFENFKAWLLKKYSDTIDLVEWNKKLDIQWHDLFWNANSETIAAIDDAYLQYFKNVFLGDYVLSFQSNDEIKGKNFDSLTKFSEESPVTIFEQQVGVFSQNITLNLLFLENITNNISIFEFIKINKSYIENSLFEFICKDNENYNWWEATFFFAVYKYTIHNPTKLQENLQDWVRIISNLIFNTAIDSPLRYKEACESIDKLVDNCTENPIHYFSKIKENDIRFFTSKQIKEEIQKAQLIKENEDWKETIIEYENHHYFYGQISFIINLNDVIDLEKFKTNANKLASLFSKDNLKEIHLLNRLFLSYKECFVQRGSNLMFYSNDYGTLRVRNENWRIIFSDYSHILKELLKIESYEEQNLEKVISENSLNHNSEAITTLIKHPYLFSYMSKRCLRKHGNSLLLLSTSRIYGYHIELFTYIYHILNKDNTEYIYGINAVDMPKYKDLIKNTEYQYSIEYNKVISLTVN